MNDVEAAAYFTEQHEMPVTPATLRDWRCRKIGPRYRKTPNGRCHYTKAWCDEFAAECEVDPARQREESVLRIRRMA